MKSVILVGGGPSVNRGITLGLWDIIKDKEVWSVNYAYKMMPYLPKAEMWVDISFLKNNLQDMENLHNQGVKLYTKAHTKNKAYPEIKQYEVSRHPDSFHGKQAFEHNIIWIGGMGLSGNFALSLAIAMGYDNIFLLGYDFGTASLSQKFTHFYQDVIKVQSTGVNHPEVYRDDRGELKQYIKEYELYAKVPDIKIWNVGKQSNIPFFEQIDWEQFFDLIKKET